MWILYFAHSALASARHIPLFLIVASPAIAMEATEVVELRFRECAQEFDSQYISLRLSADVAIGFRRTTLWIVLGAIPVVAVTAAKHWPTDFAKTFPSKMVPAQEAGSPARGCSPPTNGATTSSTSCGRVRRYLSMAEVIFTARTLGKEYLSLMNADFKWSEVVNKYGFNLMLLPVKWPLASVLKLSPEWRVVADDGTAIFFERRACIRSCKNPDSRANGNNRHRRKY